MSKKKNLNVHFSSKSDEWSTPDNIFNWAEAAFGPFDLDVCATRENARAAFYITKEQDGLSKGWRGSNIWCNPPYSELSKWLKKASEEVVRYRSRVVCLIPARTDTKAWHEYVMQKACEVYLVKGRLKFGGSKNSAPFPSALVVFDGEICPGGGPNFHSLTL